MIRAGRVLHCGRASSNVFSKPSSIFIAPVGDTLAVGDVVVVSGKLAYTGGADVVPVVVGDWSPAIFDEITQITDTGGTTIATADYMLFAAEIKID